MTQGPQGRRFDAQCGPVLAFVGSIVSGHSLIGALAQVMAQDFDARTLGGGEGGCVDGGLGLGSV